MDELEHKAEMEEEQASITQAIEGFRLNKMSRETLERNAARWLLERNSLEHSFNESLANSKKRTKTNLNYWLSGLITNEAGKPNYFGRVISKYLSKRNKESAANDRPRNGAAKPTTAELEAFRVNFKEERERDGNSGVYGWKKAARDRFGYSERHISRIFNKK